MDIRRLSTDDDLTRLVDGYVEEVAGQGGDIPHTEEAVHAIVKAVSCGVCLVAGDPAFAWTAATGCEFPWPTIYGRTAIGLGTYVSPEHRRKGIAKELRLALQGELADLGYDTLVGGVNIENKPGRESLVEEIGFTPYQILGYRRLQ